VASSRLLGTAGHVHHQRSCRRIREAGRRTRDFTNNPTRTGQGRRKQSKADLKQAGEKVKDAFKG